MLKWLFIILLFLSMSPISAAEEGTYTVTDISDYSVDYSDVNIAIPYIAIQHIDPASVSYISIDTNTFNFTTNLTASALKVTSNWQYHDKITGNDTAGSNSWLKIPFMRIYFDFGNPAHGVIDGWIYSCNIVGGTTLGSDILVVGPVYPSSEFIMNSDYPVDLYWIGLDADKLDLGFGERLEEGLMDLIRSVPYIGEYVYQVLSIVGSIISAFVILAYISIKNWTFFLVLFESFVFFHATSIMQNKQGKSSALITESFKAIASDNKLLLDLLVNVFTQIINMFVGAVRMFRG